MYVPPKFAENDPAVLWSFVDQFPFAILISEDPAHGMMISHVPVIRADQEELAENKQILYTHLAVGNHQAKLADGVSVTAIFTGPHGYVSPTWYETQPAVPTWNYTAVHVAGRVSTVTEPENRQAILRALARRFEAPGERAWDFDRLPTEFRDSQMKGIVAFEISVQSIVGKFKLSQNRPPADRAGVVRHLEQSNRTDDRSLAAFMRSYPGIV